MRTSAALVGASTLSAVLLTAGLRMAGQGHHELSAATPALAKLDHDGDLAADYDARVAAPSREWTDPPACSERSTPSQHLASAPYIPLSEPSNTETLNHSLEQATLVQTAALSQPVSELAAIQAEQVSRPEKPRRTSLARPRRKVKALKPVLANRAARRTSPPEAATSENKPFVMAGPLGDILRGLGLADRPHVNR
jgi:hypothetical protein